MVKKMPLNKTKKTDTAAVDARAWRLFGSLLSFISADIGMFKSKEKPKFAPHVVRSLLGLAHRTDATSLTDFAQILGVSLPRASRICEDLVKEGFVTRDRSEHDRREVMLHLTNEANKFNASLWEDRKPPLAATMEGFSEDEIQIIERFLQSLAHNYREAIEESE